MFAKMGLQWKQMPISSALLGISFGVPNKEPSFIHLSQSLVNEPHSRFP